MSISDYYKSHNIKEKNTDRFRRVQNWGWCWDNVSLQYNAWFTGISHFIRSFLGRVELQTCCKRLTKLIRQIRHWFFVVVLQSARVPRTLVQEMLLASDHMAGGSGLSSPPSPASTLALFSFFHFILLFWNQILICLSVRHSAWAISILRLLVKYLLKWNSFSSSSVW